MKLIVACIFFALTNVLEEVPAASQTNIVDRGRGTLSQMLWLLWEQNTDNATANSSSPTGAPNNMINPLQVNLQNQDQNMLPMSAFRFPYQSQAFENLRSEMTQEQILFHHLFRRYNKAVRPVGEQGHVVSIHVGMTLAQITDIDMRQQKMVAMFWCDQEWVDHRLSWQPDQFYGLQRLHVPFHKVWIPDIVLYNSVGQDQERDTPIENMVMIRHDGTVFLAPVMLYHSFCRLDATFFPFDFQFCWLKIGSWAHTGDVVDVEIRGEGIDTSNHMGNGEWQLIGTRAVKNIKFYPCCPEPFPEIFFYFHFRRRLLYYVFSVLAPCVIMSSVAMFTFCLPTECSEKVTLGLTVLLAYTVFQLTTTESMPKTSEFLAYISIYFTVVILTTSLTVFSSIMVVSIKESGRVKGTCPPRLLLKIFAFFKLIPVELIRSTDVFTPSKRRTELLKACCRAEKISKLPRFTKAIVLHKEPAVFEFHLRDDFNLLGRSHSQFCRLFPNIADADMMFSSRASLMDLDLYPPRDVMMESCVLKPTATNNKKQTLKKAYTSEVVWQAESSTPKIQLLSSIDLKTPKTTNEDGPGDEALLAGLKSQAMRKEVEKAAEEIRAGIDRVLHSRFTAREWVALYMGLDKILFWLFTSVHLANTLGFIVVVPLMVPKYSLDFLVSRHLASLNGTMQ